MIRITEKDLKLFENCECDKIGTNQLVAEIRASHDEIEKLKGKTMTERLTDKQIQLYAEAEDVVKQVKLMALELQQRRASDGWVSVKEKLPEDREQYLVRTILPDGSKWFKITCLTPAMTGFYVEYNTSGEYPLETVTHWKSITPPQS